MCPRLTLLFALANSCSTLLPEEIPAKLRCGLCNLVAVNAVKLPCCETSICDKCEPARSGLDHTTHSNIISGQAGLPEQCTICEHQPLSPDVCTPMKSLRMTIKAHLKTELKRRTAQASAATNAPAAVAPTPTPAPAEIESHPQETQAAASAEEEDASHTASEATVEAANNEEAVVTSTEQQDADQGDMVPTNVRVHRYKHAKLRTLANQYIRATLNQPRNTRPKKASTTKTRPIRATWR
jgi:hypothetical protein